MPNTLTEVIPQLLAQGLMALRENAVMPQLVNRQYEPMAGPEGSTIDVPIPSAITVQDVTPAATGAAVTDLAPTSVAIVLNRWKEAPFRLTDQDLLEIQNGTIPMQASEAVKAIANEVDQFLLSLGNRFFGTFGTAGTTPFGSDSTADATGIRTVLNNQVAPLDDRHCVLDPDAEGSALDVRAFQDMSWNGSIQGIIEGQLNRKMGFAWWMDQNVQSHVAGNASGMLVNEASPLVGDTEIIVDTGSGTLTVGDIIVFDGHSQQYVITTAVADVSAATLNFQPPLVAAPANSEAITGPQDSGGIGDHVMNLAFHRDAIAFATRPLSRSSIVADNVSSAVDPVSGLSLRLEITREYKQDRFSYDILYGAEVVRRELGARLLG